MYRKVQLRYSVVKGAGVSPSKPSKTKRRQGEGAVFQRCDADRGCPPRRPVHDQDGNPVLNASGKPKMERPDHKCRGMWVARLDLGDDPDTGKPHRPQRTSATEAGAYDALEELKKQVHVHGDAPTKNLTVEAWVTRWLDQIVQPRLDPATYDWYRGHAVNNIIPAIGGIKLDKLRPEHVRRMFDAMAKRGASASRGGAHRALRKALSDAMREGLVMRNVAKLVTPPAATKKNRGALTTDEGRKVLSYASRVVDGKLVDRLASRWAMALLTGARQGECLGLTWDRYDTDTGIMDLSWKLERITFSHGCGEPPEHGKVWPCGKIHGGRCPDRELRVPEGYEYTQLDGGLCLTRPKSVAGQRIIPAPPPLVAALNLHRKNDTAPNPHGLVWHETNGRPIEPADDTKAWDTLLRGAGVPDVVLHEARHTTVTLLMEAGVDPHIIKEIAGHSSLVVQEGYKHASTKHKAEALAKVSEKLYAIES